MRYLFLCLLLVSYAFAEVKTNKPKSDNPKLVAYQPALPQLPPQKMLIGVKAPVLPRIMVPRNAKNIAYKKLVTADYGALYGSLDQIVDGQKDVWMTLPKGLRWVQIDLSVPSQIYAIHLWHGFAAPYVYRDVMIQISDDKTFRKGVVTVFNNSLSGIGPNRPYLESRNGLLLDTGGPNRLGVLGRYVRFWSNGNQIDKLNRYLEIAVIGTSDLEEVKFELPPATYQGARPRKDEVTKIVVSPHTYQ